MLGLSASISKAAASMRSYVKDNLKLYLDFKENKSNTLKFPCEGSTDFGSSASNYYINLGTGASLRGQTSGSICGWINASNLTSYHAIITEWNNGGFMNWGLWTSGQNLHFDDGGGTACTATSDALSLNTWHHVCITKDGTTITLYVDGVQEKQITNGAASVDNNGTGNVFIGIKENLTDDFLGKMANIGMWHRVLSLEEINSVMRKNYSQLKSVEKTSLVSWWSLDEEVADSTQLLNQATYFYDADDWLGYGGGTFDDAGGTHIAVTAGTTSEYEQGGYLYTNVSYFNGTSSNWYVGGRYRLISTTTSSIGSTTSGLSMYGHRVASAQDDLPSGSSVYDFTGATNIHNLSFFRFHDMAQGETLTTTLEIYHLLAKDQHGSNNGRQYGTGITAGTQTLGSADSPTVYGGNAPVLPRAVDVAREGQADAIGNGSALLDGTDDYIQVDNITLPNLEPYTITAWIKTTDVDQTQAIALWGDQASYERRALIIYNGGGGSDWTLVASTNGDNPQGATNVTEGEWTHASITVTPATKAYKIYMNGILDGSGTFSNTLVAFSNSTLLIGKSYYGEFFEGNISGVGIWYGELTQAQIQSVMESTSYDKIPADVKSTIGSELFDADASTFDSGTHSWVVYGSNTIANDSGALKITYVDDARGAYLWFKDASDLSSDLTVGKLYRLTFDAKVNSGSSVDVSAHGSSVVGATVTETSFTSKSIDFVCSNATTNYLDALSMGSGEIVWIDNLSLKEVTNEIAGYWALDSTENNLNVKNVTPNSLGENLGDEEFRGSYAPKPYLGSDWEITGGSASVTEDSSTRYVTFITTVAEFSSENQHRGGKIEFTSANSGMLTGQAVANQIYKIVVSGYMSETNGQSVASYPSLYAGTYQYESADVWTTEETTKTYYFTASHLNNDTFYPTYNMKAGQQFTLTGISVKKVNGNYGSLN